jgi:hypothetical protein
MTHKVPLRQQIAVLGNGLKLLEAMGVHVITNGSHITIAEGLFDDSLLRQMEDDHIGDVNFWLPPKVDPSEPFLFVSDLDSTLMPLETIDELAALAGVEAQVKVLHCYGMYPQDRFLGHHETSHGGPSRL